MIPKKLLGDLRRVTDEFVDKSRAVETHTDVFVNLLLIFAKGERKVLIVEGFRKEKITKVLTQ